MKLFVFIVQLFESSTKDLFIIFLYLMSFFSAILRITVQILFLSALPSVSQYTQKNSLKKELDVFMFATKYLLLLLNH